MLTDEQKREVIERRLAGEFVAEIARHYGVSLSTIYRVTDPASPPGGWRLKRRHKMTGEQVQEAIALRMAGGTLDEIAKPFGVSRETIRGIVASVPRPPHSHARTTRGSLTSEQIQEAIAKREAGETIRAIASHFRVGKTSIRIIVQHVPRPPGTRKRASRCKLTGEQRLEVIALRVAGEALQDIARHYGVGRSTISRITHQVSLPGGRKLKRRRKMTDEQQQEAIARRMAGENAKSIARHYGVSSSTIYKIAKHVPRPPGGWRRPQRRKLTDEQEQDAITRRRAGEKLKDIASSYNVGTAIIRRITKHVPKVYGSR